MFGHACFGKLFTTVGAGSLRLLTSHDRAPIVLSSLIILLSPNNSKLLQIQQLGFPEVLKESLRQKKRGQKALFCPLLIEK